MESFSWKRFIILQGFIIVFSIMTQYIWTGEDTLLDFFVIPIWTFILGALLYGIGLFLWKLSKRRVMFHIVMGTLSIILIPILVNEIIRTDQIGWFGNYFAILVFLSFIFSVCTSYAFFFATNKTKKSDPE